MKSDSRIHYKECFTINYMEFIHYHAYKKRTDEIKEWCFQNIPFTDYEIEIINDGMSVFLYTEEAVFAYKLRWQ